MKKITLIAILTLVSLIAKGQSFEKVIENSEEYDFSIIYSINTTEKTVYPTVVVEKKEKKSKHITAYVFYKKNAYHVVEAKKIKNTQNKLYTAVYLGSKWELAEVSIDENASLFIFKDLKKNKEILQINTEGISNSKYITDEALLSWVPENKEAMLKKWLDKE